MYPRDSSHQPTAFPNSPKIPIFTTFNRKITIPLSANPLNINLHFSRKSGLYRYSFQRQEVSKEYWEGAVEFKYRVEDARLGRFFSVDPLFKKYPHWSPYVFSGNQLIHTVELEGLEPWSDANKYGEQLKTQNKGKTKETETKKIGLNKTRTNQSTTSEEAKTTEKKVPVKEKEVPFIEVYPDELKINGVSVGNNYDMQGSVVDGEMTGAEGWEKQGKSVFTGTISVVTAPIGIAAKGAVSIVGWCSLVSGVDDVCTNTEGESLAIQIAPEEYKRGILFTKFTIGVSSIATGGGGLISTIRSGYATGTELAPAVLGIVNDTYSTVNTYNSIPAEKKVEGR